MVTAGKLPEVDKVWKVLEGIVDPEIPVVNIVEMKLVRDVQVAGDEVTLVFSPSFVGCPAVDVMKTEMCIAVQKLGFSRVTVETTFSPPWTTNMLDASVRDKLRLFGIAPPPEMDDGIVQALSKSVDCPWCGSSKTHLESSFGSTLCRQIFYCEKCRQSFERFKPL